MKIYTKPDEVDLANAVEERFGAKEYVYKGRVVKSNISREASFAKKVFELGIDAIDAGVWGIKELGLNRNALNAEYNNIEKHVWAVDYFCERDF